MATKRMSWREMKRLYPDEWLLITDFALDTFGEVSEGVVARHSKKKDKAAFPAIVDRDTAFCYTGQSTFAGLRSHATGHHAH